MYLRLNMLDIAPEPRREPEPPGRRCNKFFEHFGSSLIATNSHRGRRRAPWDERDGFYYDGMRPPSGESLPVRVPLDRSGLTPCFAVATLEAGGRSSASARSGVARRFLQNRPELVSTPHLPVVQEPPQQSMPLVAGPIGLADRENGERADVAAPAPDRAEGRVTRVGAGRGGDVEGGHPDRLATAVAGALVVEVPVQRRLVK